jgi:hypothetical protein
LCGVALIWSQEEIKAKCLGRPLDTMGKIWYSNCVS